MSLQQTLGQALIADARLAILAELAQQRDGSLNQMGLGRVIDALGVRRSREWCETQLHFLADLGAVELKSSDLPGIGTVLVARLTRIGRDHVEARSCLAGVSAPADPG